jgi:small subunit ribosomal protein S4
MASNFGPKCKICRREGNKLFLKGEKCYTSKCPFIKRKYPPGVHGPKRTARLSEYAKQLRAKQRARKIYGLTEKQFYAYYQKASRQKGNKGIIFLSLLERRLDNIIYRSKVASSRALARQLISHGDFLINGRSVNIPSYIVSEGDIIEIKKSKINKKVFENIKEKIAKKDLPSWFNVDKESGKIKILSIPTPDDLVEDINLKLIVEYYSRR